MIYIIHIGKCGGGSLIQELKKKNKDFQVCHCKKPKIKKNFKYIILIRDPINRFISAFNWKMFRCTTEEGYYFQGMSKPKNSHEIEGYKYWNNINNFAENLYDKNRNINDMALKLIKNSNHLHFDINYYLEKILPFCNKNNCDIIRYEYYHDDINKVFNIESISSKSHVYTKSYNKYISDKGIKNIKKFLEKDYICFQKLREKNIINDEYYQNILSGNFILKNMTGKNILILHIPKTGGNSIQNFFSRLENFNSYSIGHDINSCKTGGQIKLFVNGNYIKDSRIDNLNNFFKITIVRNPYDRIVSHYNFELTTLENHLKIFDIAEKKYNEKLNNLNFSTRKQIFNEVFFDWQSSDKKINSKTLFKYEIIKNKYEFLKSLGFKKWVKLHGSKHKYNYNTFIEKSDYVIKFENIDTDFEKLKVLLDIKTDSTILHLNKSNRKLDYRDYYDEETKEFVYKLFEDDIKLFNYEF